MSLTKRQVINTAKLLGFKFGYEHPFNGSSQKNEDDIRVIMSSKYSQFSFRVNKNKVT